MVELKKMWKSPRPLPQRKKYSFQNKSVHFASLHSWEENFSKNRPSGPIISISQNVRMFVCLFVCLSHFLTPFNGLCPPTSQIPISWLFRYSESLGKNNRKKVVSDLKNLAHKRCKIATLEKLLQIFFISSLRLNVFLPPLPEVQYPWRKVMERSGLRFKTFAHKGCKIGAQFFSCCFLLPNFALQAEFVGTGATHRLI